MELRKLSFAKTQDFRKIQIVVTSWIVAVVVIGPTRGPNNYRQKKRQIAKLSVQYPLAQ